MEKKRPEFITDEMLEFLDDLIDSGKTNMFGALSYILEKYTEELTTPEAKKLLGYWMETFGRVDR